MSKYKIGTKGTCRSCDGEIEYNGEYWFHVNSNPRHPAIPIRPIKEYNEYDLTDISDTRFATTDFLVEANRCETHYLYKDCMENDVEWLQDNSGISVNVGEVNNMPVNISVLWNTIDGLKVLFWHPLSHMVDYVMIEKWFERNCSPKYCKGERRAVTDAQNFHHVIHEARDRKDKWHVTGDHPISLRPDKYGLTREEAEAYAKELEKYGFENIKILVDKKD